jgi:hypothetical protein
MHLKHHRQCMQRRWHPGNCHSGARSHQRLYPGALIKGSQGIYFKAIRNKRQCFLRRTHVIQRNLRPPGGKGYAIPHGFGFDHITCANYTFEIYGWVLFAAATWTLPALIFITAGAAQMAIWAKAKHARLRKVTTSLRASAPGNHISLVAQESGETHFLILTAGLADHENTKAFNLL